MTQQVLDTTLRFHLVVDAAGTICHVGPSLHKLLPDSVGQPLSDVLDSTHSAIDLSEAPSAKWQDVFVHLRFTAPRFTLRGEFLPYDDDTWFFAGSLDPVDADRVIELGLVPRDFAPSDFTMDFSMLKWSRDSQIRETRLALLKLRRSISEGERLKERADTDDLTGVASRSRFLRATREAIDANAERRNIAVVMVDIAGFKSINDLFGHDVGDQVLVHVARRLEWIAGEPGLVAHMGGDEFAILLQSSELTPRLEQVVDELSAKIAKLNQKPAVLGNRTLRIQLTVGVAFQEDQTDAAELLRHAAIGMRATRGSADESVGIFDPALQQELELHRCLADDLPGAIARHEIKLFFQPIVDLSTRRVVKFEVLSRWTHPIHGPIMPSLFFEVAQQSQLIGRLDRYVIEQALLVARDRLSPNGVVPMLSINVSTLSLSDDLADFLRQTLDTLHYPANRVCVEVTETSSIINMERTSRVLRDLDGLGIIIALDDFGTGFSSLTYLHQLPIGELKIDRSFVADMLESRKALELVRSILHVARSLDLPVVAEGIETVEQYLLLESLGCDHGQGYYFAHPAPAQAASATVGRMLPFSRSELDPTKPDDGLGLSVPDSSGAPVATSSLCLSRVRTPAPR